jgi:Ca-activated chloride channel family protein
MRCKTTYMPALVVALCVLFPPPARARDWLRSANQNVEQGNEKMKDKEHQAALQSYDKAARELPSAAGVQLNRGLALMAGGKLPEAREAFLRATEPPAPDAVRADAYYNLGVAFYREADQKAGENDHEQAAKLFREAEDSLRRSLRTRPGDANAAWNLELAMRREREEKKKDEQQKQEQQKQEQQEQQEQQQEQQQDQKQDQQQQDQQQQDQQQQDQDEQKPDQKKQPPQPEKQKGPEEKKGNEQKQEQRPERTEEKRPLPRDVARALDALQDSEENLERHRARIRAARERRRPEKDW